MTAQEMDKISSEFLILRDKFKLIERGVIEKGRNIDRNALRRETRKLTLADAKQISRCAAHRVNDFLDELREAKL